MKFLTKFAAAVLLLGLSVMPALAQDTDARLDTVFGEHETFRDAFDALTAAVREGDSATVASLVKYPFEITIDGEEYTLGNENEFIGWYEDIFTPAMTKVVAEQSYDTLFVNQDGVMFGNGELWLSAICIDNACNRSYWVVTAINLPE
jgi:hypothetical protein